MKEDEKRILADMERLRLVTFFETLRDIDRRIKKKAFSKQQNSDPPKPRNPPK